MSSRVANHLPHIDPLIWGMRSKSQGEMSGEYGRCSKSPHPQRRISCSTDSALCDLALSYRVITLSSRSDNYPERHVVPVKPGSLSSTERTVLP
ncbi:hypothetical protein TNCV_3075451 [Trichonephila clavipes]|nr:hypothetical protein TNCV_3075451 [Trichonephila clavipes]